MRNFFLIILLFTTSNLFAENQFIEKQTLGFGNSYQDAVSNALLTAVRQVRGMEISTEKNVKSVFNQITDKSGTTHSTATVSTVTDVYDISKGWVKSFKVIDIIGPKTAPEKEGIWQVKLSVTIPQFESKFKQDARLKLAIMPFRINSHDFSLKHSNASVTQVSRRLADSVTKQLHQSQKFVIVNRSYTNEMATEKDLLSSDNVPPEEASRIGQILGADLMVVGNIHELKTDVESQDLYGVENQKLTDQIDVYFSTIETSTGKVISTNSINVEYLRKKDENTISPFLTKIAQRISHKIIKELYPDSHIANDTSPEERTSSKRPTTPGSSEKPFSW